MKYVDFIFVSPEGFIHEVIGGVVKFFTKSKYAHAALGMELPALGFPQPVIAEMYWGGLRIQDYNKFDNELVMRKITLPFEEENYLKAQELVGEFVASKVKYGLLTDCVGGGLADFCGEKYGKWWDEHVADKYPETMDCSELDVRVARIQYPNLCIGMDSNIVTPERLLVNIQSLYEDLLR